MHCDIAHALHAAVLKTGMQSKVCHQRSFECCISTWIKVLDLGEILHVSVSVLSSWLPFGIIRNENVEGIERREETHVPSNQSHDQSSTLIERMLVRALLERLGGEENDMDNEQRKDFIKQAMEILLPPPIVYRSHERRSRSSNGCAICMEDFEDGDWCRIFSACTHMFHSICIENWLRNHLTCPLCRISIVDSFLLNV